MRIHALNLPEGVHPAITDRDFVIATVSGTSALESEEAAAEAEAAAQG